MRQAVSAGWRQGFIDADLAVDCCNRNTADSRESIARGILGRIARVASEWAL